MIPKVSVIIPVYKAEKFIECCARSLFEQTLDDLEFIFVDDCSRDRSIEFMERVLDEYPQRRPQVKIIHHEMNQGVSAARQHGVDSANGEYIIHCDSDDWVDHDMYEALYSEAIARNADIVGCDFIEEHEGLQTIKRQNLNQSRDAIVLEILKGSIHSSLWSQMISRDFIKRNNVRFMPGLTLLEDMLYIVPLHLATDRVAYIAQPYYHYRIVDDSITHTFSKRNVDSAILALHELKKYIDGNENLIRQWEKTFCWNAQPLITNPLIYDSARWKGETSLIKKPYFGSLKNRISPWLIRHRLDWLNRRIVKLYRLNNPNIVEQ